MNLEKGQAGPDTLGYFALQKCTKPARLVRILCDPARLVGFVLSGCYAEVPAGWASTGCRGGRRCLWQDQPGARSVQTLMSAGMRCRIGLRIVSMAAIRAALAADMLRS